MHNQHKIHRVLQLIALLKAKPAKSISHLKMVLSSSERTVYRYIDLLDALGFEVLRDGQKRVYIDHSSGMEGFVPFTEQETRFLRDLIRSTASRHKLASSVLTKLPQNSDVNLGGELLHQARLGTLVQGLSTAMHDHRQVVLKNYHSVNSNEVSDRLVEPIRFTDNYDNLVAFEVSTKKNKYFHLERIGDIQVRRSAFRYGKLHKFHPPDVFGFSDNGKRYGVELTLSLRAAMILKEEYPMTASLLRRVRSGYRLKTTVFDLKPVTRFVIGFFGEIKVNGSVEFKQHLRKQLEKQFGAVR